MRREETTNVRMIEEVLRNRPDVYGLFKIILALPEELRGEAATMAKQVLIGSRTA